MEAGGQRLLSDLVDPNNQNWPQKVAFTLLAFELRLLVGLIFSSSPCNGKCQAAFEAAKALDYGTTQTQRPIRHHAQSASFSLELSKNRWIVRRSYLPTWLPQGHCVISDCCSLSNRIGLGKRRFVFLYESASPIFRSGLVEKNKSAGISVYVAFGYKPRNKKKRETRVTNSCFVSFPWEHHKKNCGNPGQASFGLWF